MASHSRSARRRASSSPGRSSTSPRRASSGHRNVRRRASFTPTLGHASSTPTPGPATPTPRRASSTPTPRRASSRHCNASKIMKGPWKLSRRRRRQLCQKVLKASSVIESPTRVPVQEGHEFTFHIPDELYELFVSEKEEKKSSEFHDFFTSEAAVTAINVPGQKSGEQYLRYSDSARSSSATLIDWLFILKDAGYSLSGCFDASDFLVTYFGHFKGKRSLVQKLKKYKVKRGKRDMAAAADVIEKGICSGIAVLPAEVRHLVSLLRDFKRRNSFVIRHHASLYNELGKDVLFSSMYGRLKKLQNLNNTKYLKVIGKIPYCSGKDRWKPRVRKNTHLASVLDKEKPPNQNVKIAFRVRSRKYKGNGGELLRFLRNALQHLPDFSVGKPSAAAAATPSHHIRQPSASASGMNQQLPCLAASAASRSQQIAQPGLGSGAVSQMVDIYRPDDSEHMFAVAVPDLLVDFQLAMSDEG